MTAPVAGTFRVDARGGISIIDAAGAVTAISFSKQYRDVILLQSNGASVVQGVPVASATYSGFSLQATLTPSDVLRFLETPSSARAQIAGSGSPFDCQLLDLKPTYLSDDLGSTIACAIPDSQRVVAGLDAVIAVQFATTKDVLVLPIDAVAGTLSSGVVFVVTADGVERRDVQLGSTDGFRIAVTAGLTEGEVVAIPSPSMLDED